MNKNEIWRAFNINKEGSVTAVSNGWVGSPFFILRDPEYWVSGVHLGSFINWLNGEEFSDDLLVGSNMDQREIWMGRDRETIIDVKGPATGGFYDDGRFCFIENEDEDYSRTFTELVIRAFDLGERFTANYREKFHDNELWKKESLKRVRYLSTEKVML